MLESDLEKKWLAELGAQGPCSGLYIMNFITIFPRSFWFWTKGFKLRNLKKIWQNVQIGTEWKSNSSFFSYQKLNNLFRGWNGGVNRWLVFLQNIRLQLLTWLGYSTTRHHQKILFKIEIYIIHFYYVIPDDDS